jgi:hypothetical protein
MVSLHHLISLFLLSFTTCYRCNVEPLIRNIPDARYQAAQSMEDAERIWAKFIREKNIRLVQ